MPYLNHNIPVEQTIARANNMRFGNILDRFSSNDIRTNPDFDPNATTDDYYSDEYDLPVIETKPDAEKRKLFIGKGPNWLAKQSGAVGPEELNARFNAQMQLADVATKRKKDYQSFMTDEELRKDKGTKQNTQAIAELAYSFNPVDPAFDEALKEYPANVRQASLSQPGLRSKLFKQVTDWNEAQSNNRLQNSIYKDQAARQRWLQGELDPSLAGAAIVLPAAEQAANNLNEYGTPNIVAKFIAQNRLPVTQNALNQISGLSGLNNIDLSQKKDLREDKLADAEIAYTTEKTNAIKDGIEKGEMQPTHDPQLFFDRKNQQWIQFKDPKTRLAESVTGKQSPLYNVIPTPEAQQKLQAAAKAKFEALEAAKRQQQNSSVSQPITTKPVINQPVPIVGDGTLSGQQVVMPEDVATNMINSPAPTAVPQVQTKPTRVQTSQPVQFTPNQPYIVPLNPYYKGPSRPMESSKELTPQEWEQLRTQGLDDVVSDYIRKNILSRFSTDRISR